MADVNKDVTILHVEFKEAKGPSKLEKLMSSLKKSPTKQSQNPYKLQKPKEASRIELHQTQTIIGPGGALVDCQVISDNMLALMDSDCIRLFTRPSVHFTPPPKTEEEKRLERSEKRKAWKDSQKLEIRKDNAEKEKAAAAVGTGGTEGEAKAATSAQSAVVPAVPATSNLSKAGGDNSAATSREQPKYNPFVQTGQISMKFISQHKIPLLLRQVAADELLIGFDDGSIQVVLCPSLLDPPTNHTVALKELAASEAAAIAEAAAALEEDSGSLKSSRSSARSRRSSRSGRRTACDKAVQLPPTLATTICDYRPHFVGGPVDPALLGDPLIDPDGDGGAYAGGQLRPRSRGVETQAEVGTSALRPRKLKPTGVLLAATCPWRVVGGGQSVSAGTGGYALEILTVGSDERVVHWGLRYKPGREKVKLQEHFISEWHRKRWKEKDAPPPPDPRASSSKRSARPPLPFKLLATPPTSTTAPAAADSSAAPAGTDRAVSPALRPASTAPPSVRSAPGTSRSDAPMPAVAEDKTYETAATLTAAATATATTGGSGDGSGGNGPVDGAVNAPGSVVALDDSTVGTVATLVDINQEGLPMEADLLGVSCMCCTALINITAMV